MTSNMGSQIIQEKFEESKRQHGRSHRGCKTEVLSLLKQTVRQNSLIVSMKS
jgi:ATP-dependent Clp protease ATP-binding subunit ClpB